MPNFVLVSSPSSDRPIQVNIACVSAVVGPVQVTIPVSPGLSKTSWVIDVYMQEGIKHSCVFVNKTKADDVIARLSAVDSGKPPL